MKKLAFLLCLMAGAASAQTYDLDLVMDGNAFTGQFTYDRHTDVFTNVSIAGDGMTLNSGEDLEAGIADERPAADYLWFINPQQQTLGIQLLAPLGRKSSTFTDVYLNTTGTQAGSSWCDPGPSTCFGMSLIEVRADPVGRITAATRAPELDPSSMAAALTLLGCCVLMWGGKRERR
jgi:hypothetical protein